jgi:hypothetical protein
MTTTVRPTLKAALDKAQPHILSDVLAKVKLGTMLTPLKRAFTGLSAAASFDLTAIDATGETAGASNPNRLAALSVIALRIVTSGTAASVGAYVVTDTGGTAVTTDTGARVGIAKISDDGKTITFPNTVTAFTIEYMPRSYEDLTDVDGALDGSP